MLPPETEAALRTPLVQQGVIANREELEAITLYSYEQDDTEKTGAKRSVFSEYALDK